MKTRPLALAALLTAALALTGCVAAAPDNHAQTRESHADNVAEISDTDTQDVAEVDVEEVDEAGDGLSPRGFLPKELGEVGGILDGDVPVVEFTLTDIQHDYQCGEYSIRSEHGSYVGLHFDVEVFPEWADQDYALGSFMMSSYDFQAFDADGQRVNDVTGNAYSCAEASDELPYDIGAGQSASGWIILDLPEDAEIVAYVMSIEGIGIEWQLP